MKIEQTSNLIKVSNRIIQGFVNAVVSVVKVNPQEIAIPSAVSKGNHVNKYPLREIQHIMCFLHSRFS
jgi:hypothetical protein